MKTAIVYHAHCIDGFMAAVVTKKYLLSIWRMNEDLEMLPAEYQNLEALEDKLTKAEQIYVVDFSFPIDIVERLATTAKHITIIDHHKTAFEMYEGFTMPENVELVMAMDKCGAQLAWERFFPSSEVPKLIRYIGEYDLWTKQLPYTDQINKYLRIQPHVYTNWIDMLRSFENTYSVEHYIDNGLAIQAYHDSVVRDICDTATEVELCGYKGLAANCSPHFASDVGHELANRSGSYGATWQQLGNDVKWSLRSTGDYDVSAICKMLGGGGHRNAAGFKLSAPKKEELFPEEESFVGISIWGTGEGD